MKFRKRRFSTGEDLGVESYELDRIRREVFFSGVFKEYEKLAECFPEKSAVLSVANLFYILLHCLCGSYSILTSLLMEILLKKIF